MTTKEELLFFQQPGWMSDILNTRVANVEVRHYFETPVSRIHMITLHFEETTDLPRQLFLKCSKPEVEKERRLDGKREIAFYQHVFTDASSFASTRCFLADYTEEDNSYMLLLEDISETHEQLMFGLPPNQQDTELIITALGRHHATWWNHEKLKHELPSLIKDAGKWRLCFRDACEDILSLTAETYETFADFMGDRLSDKRRNIYEHFFNHQSSYVDLLCGSKNQTLVHGDAHQWNYLMPRDRSKGRAYLIDWQNWDVGPGIRDMAYMMTLYWFQEHRAATEQNYLDFYHQTLTQNGVSNYSKEEMLEEYRIWTAFNIIYPIWSWTYGLWPDLWYPQLDKAMAAFEDWKCQALFDS